MQIHGFEKMATALSSISY